MARPASPKELRRRPVEIWLSDAAETELRQRAKEDGVPLSEAGRAIINVGLRVTRGTHHDTP